MHTGHSGGTSQDVFLPPHSDKSNIEGCVFCIPHKGQLAKQFSSKMNI